MFSLINNSLDFNIINCSIVLSGVALLGLSSYYYFSKITNPFIDQSTQTDSNYVDQDTQTIQTLVDNNTQTVQALVDNSTQTVKILMENSSQTAPINTLIDVQQLISNELLEKLLGYMYLENSTATTYTYVSVSNFIEQIRFNPDYTVFFNELDNYVINWASKIQSPISPSIGQLLSNSPTTSVVSLETVSSTSSTETILPVLLKSQQIGLDNIVEFWINSSKEQQDAIELLIDNTLWDIMFTKHIDLINSIVLNYDII